MGGLPIKPIHGQLALLGTRSLPLVLDDAADDAHPALDPRKIVPADRLGEQTEDGAAGVIPLVLDRGHHGVAGEEVVGVEQGLGVRPLLGVAVLLLGEDRELGVSRVRGHAGRALQPRLPGARLLGGDGVGQLVRHAVIPVLVLDQLGVLRVHLVHDQVGHLQTYSNFIFIMLEAKYQKKN